MQKVIWPERTLSWLRDLKKKIPDISFKYAVQDHVYSLNPKTDAIAKELEEDLLRELGGE